MNDDARPPIDPEISRLIDEVVATKINAEREFIKSTIGLSMKIAGGAIVVALAVVTWMGIENLGDIEATIEEAANNQMDIFIRDSASKDLERRIDQLYVRSIIGNYLQQDLQQAGVSGHKKHRLTRLETQKMFEVISNPDSTREDFTGAIEVLKTQANNLDWDGFERTLRRMLNGPDEYDWVKNSHDRWASMINLATAAHLRSTDQIVRDILIEEASDVPPQVTVAALEHMHSIDEVVAEQVLEKMVISSNKDLRAAALGSMAHSYPYNSVLMRSITDLTGGSPSVEGLQASANIVRGLLQGVSTPIESDGSSGLKLEKTEHLLSYISQSRNASVITGRRTRRSETVILRINRQQHQFEIPFDGFKWTIEKMLKDSAMTGDSDQVLQLLKFIAGHPESDISFRAKFGVGSGLGFAGSRFLRSKDIPAKGLLITHSSNMLVYRRLREDHSMEEENDYLGDRRILRLEKVEGISFEMVLGS